MANQDSDQDQPRDIDEDAPKVDDVSVEELNESSAAGTAFSIGSAGCPSSVGTASSFG